MKLRPRRRVVIEQVKIQTATLLDSHIRENGESTPHSCTICRAVLRMRLDGPYPEWVQCSECKDVMHQACFDKWVMEHSTAKCSCPSCRRQFERADYETDPDTWSAIDLQSIIADEVERNMESIITDGVESSDDDESCDSADLADSNGEDSEDSDSEDSEDDSVDYEPSPKRTRRGASRS